MALTQLDSVAALVVIDLQKGIVAFPTAQPVGGVINRSVQLAHAFRGRGLPVVLVNVVSRAPGRTQAGFPKREFPPDWSDLVPELGQHSEDYRVTKHHIGAFIGTSLDEFLRSRGVTQVFMAGVATSVGVEMTGRCAYDCGYNVVYVEDAMTDMSAEAHLHSVEKVFPRFGEVDTTENVLKALAG
jgi:Amidases related to nicotinamidase